MRQQRSTFTSGRMAQNMSGRYRKCLLVLFLGVSQLVQAQVPASRAAVEAKLAPGLRALPSKGTAQTVRVSVPDKAAFQQWVRQHLPAARVSQPGSSAHTLTVAGLDAAGVLQLAASPAVDFVDVVDRKAHEERQLNNSDLSVNAISALHARFPQLAGQGLTASVKERPFNPADIDFKGRVLNAATFTSPLSEHATAMATLIGGAGNSHPKGRGVARQVRLATSLLRDGEFLPDDIQQLLRDGVSVQNHSYGVAIENYYGIESQEYDRQVKQYPTLLHVFSSGNVGREASPSGAYQGIAAFANITGQFKMSKNTLTVGATDPSGQVSSFSSRGPAHDGRIKPELVAYGEGGSSESAALVSGLSIVLQQVYRDQHAGALPPASLLKAVLLNSADDLGRPEVDHVSGFGQADALGAVATMHAQQFFVGTVAQSAEQAFTVRVGPGQQQLKATLAWTDAEAAANATRALVNDLDLELVSTATGQRWRPWVLSSYPRADSLALPARRGLDRLNNVEQITLAAPAPGTYELRVRGFAVAQGPQAFSLAYEINPLELTWTFPTALDNVRPGANAALHWHWTGPATTARLEYRPVGRAQWRLVNAAVDLALNSAVWAAPDTTTLAQLRLVAGSQVFPSDTFALVQAPRVDVGFTCPDATLLQWPRVPGASGYQVYQLGATTLEPLLQTADTTLQLTRAQMQNHYYAVGAILRRKITEPTTTIDYATQGTSCYFRSFLPRQLVDERLDFDVVLGSVVGLQSATLERLGANGYQAVQTISPVLRPTFTFSDQPAEAARYLYRVRLTTTTGQVIYSNVEEAYLLRANAAQAFPNPVTAGEPLSLVTNTEAGAEVQLYDVLGRLQRQQSVEGVFNLLDTNGLRPGLYQLRVVVQGQAEQHIRIIVK